jgi:hypothetical protein
MAKDIWQEQDENLSKTVDSIRIPDAKLTEVSVVEVKTIADINLIPQSGGCYWIWTNEPVLHSLHRNKTPESFDNGEIIYNGIAKDNVRNRIRNHLLGSIDAGWSGISLDLYFGKTTSHRKKALSPKGKVPYFKKQYTLKRGNKKKGTKKGDTAERLESIRDKSDLLKINLSSEEVTKVSSITDSIIYFRNGIDIREEKHKAHTFKVYYITGISPLYIDLIEKKWREVHCLHKLCTYSS